VKRGPKTGRSRWRDYIIRRLSDGLYFSGISGGPGIGKGNGGIPQWVADPADAYRYHGIRAARLIVGNLEARRERTRANRCARVHWGIIDPDDPTWEAYWPW
jgi:hypothetical protein